MPAEIAVQLDSVSKRWGDTLAEERRAALNFIQCITAPERTAAWSITTGINSVKLIDHLFILTKGGPSNASKLCCTKSTRTPSRSSTRPTPPP